MSNAPETTEQSDNRAVALDLRSSVDRLRLAVAMEKSKVAAREADASDSFRVEALKREEDRLMEELAGLQGVSKNEVQVPELEPTPGFSTIEQAAENERRAAEARRNAAESQEGAQPIVIERPVDPATLSPEEQRAVAEAEAARVQALGDLVPVEDAKKDVLKAAAADAGLSVSGNKDELVERLHDAGVDTVATGDNPTTSRPGR